MTPVAQRVEDEEFDTCDGCGKTGVPLWWSTHDDNESGQVPTCDACRAY